MLQSERLPLEVWISELYLEPSQNVADGVLFRENS